MAWSKDDKQRLAGTGGRVIGHARNHENRHQQHCENRSAHVATIGALTCTCSFHFFSFCCLCFRGNLFLAAFHLGSFSYLLLFIAMVNKYADQWWIYVMSLAVVKRSAFSPHRQHQPLAASDGRHRTSSGGYDLLSVGMIQLLMCTIVAWSVLI